MKRLNWGELIQDLGERRANGVRLVFGAEISVSVARKGEAEE